MSREMAIRDNMTHSSFLERINDKMMASKSINQQILANIEYQMAKRQKKDEEMREKCSQIDGWLGEMKDLMAEMREQCRKEYKNLFDQVFIQTMKAMKMYQSKIIRLQNELNHYKYKESIDINMNIQTDRQNQNISHAEIEVLSSSLRESVELDTDPKYRKIKICDIIASYQSSIKVQEQKHNLSILFKNEDIPELFQRTSNKNQKENLKLYESFNYSRTKDNLEDINGKELNSSPNNILKSSNNLNFIHINQLRTELQNFTTLNHKNKIRKEKENRQESYKSVSNFSQKKSKQLSQLQNMVADTPKESQFMVFESKIGQLRRNMLSRHKKK